MSTRTFIIALSTLLLAAVGFILWTVQDGEAPRTPITQETPNLSSKKTLAFSTPSHSNRFKKTLTDPSIRWQVRVDMLRRLDASTLNPSEVDYLFALLRHEVDPRQNEAWWVVLNEIMEQMRKQQIEPERFDTAMLGLIEDPSLHSVVRDYAIQHIAISLKENPSKARAEAVIATLTQVIQSPSAQHSSMVGTTLMAMVDASISEDSTAASEVKPVVDQAFTELEPMLMPIIAGDNTANLATRTSAINAVGLLGLPQYLPAIRTIVQNDQSNDSAKLSAIASLGAYYAAQSTSENTPIESDVAMLQALAASNTKFKYAATAALQKLSQ